MGIENGLENRNGRHLLTTSDVARYCAVSNDGVLKWIKSGKLKAFATPGGHYRIRSREFRAFLEAHEIPVDGAALADVDGRRTAVVAGGEPDGREGISWMLHEIEPRLRVELVCDSFQAGIKIASLEPVLVVLDVMNPAVDGLPLCRSIRGNPETRNVRVLAIAAVRAPAEVEALCEAGADVCLVKPVLPQQLRHKMERMLRDDHDS